MTTQVKGNAEQAAFWSGEMGETWVANMAFIENMLAPFRDAIIDHVAQSGKRAVLDLGCGNGSVALELSKQMAPDATVVGIDISEPMIRNARVFAVEQGGGVQFIHGDAASYDFGKQRFDSLVSRFGCMFFADPVGAFAHLRGFMVDHSDLTLVAWRDVAMNELFAAGIQAARDAFPLASLPPGPGPGAFSFADQDWVASTLLSAGWCDASLETLDVACSFPESGLRMFIDELAPTGLQNASLD
ncbi:MAG: class I SAM-dependent methyltransferase, partial [Pseudomonadota bacterium]